MTETEWLECSNVLPQQNHFLLTKPERQLQLFLCACCRRVDGSLSSEVRERVSGMARYFKPGPDVAPGDVWDVCRQAVEVAERFADGLATDEERRNAAQAASSISQHFGDIAACAPIPGEDPNYDDAAVKMGGDAAAAADCAASILPNAAELNVRVAATSVAPDEEAYYAGAHGYSGVDPSNSHLQARRAERAAQWKLLVDILGDGPEPAAPDPAWLRWNGGTVQKLTQEIYDNREFGRMPELAQILENAGCKNVGILSHCRRDNSHVRGCWVLDLLLGKK